LPDAYQEVEYIQSSGTQYLSLGSFGNVIWWWEIKLNPLSLYKNYEAYIGNSWWRPATWKLQWRSGWIYFQWEWPNWSYEWTIWALNTTQVISFDSNWLKTDWVVKSSITPWNWGSWNVWICWNSWESSYLSTMQLYYVKIWAWWTLVRECIPCYRKSDSVIWAYDIVNDVFYTNSGSWTFTKWEDIIPENLSRLYIWDKLIVGGECITPYPDLSKFQLTYTKFWYTDLHAIACSRDWKELFISHSNTWNLYRHSLSDWTLNTYNSTATQSKNFASLRWLYISPNWKFIAWDTDWDTMYYSNMSTAYDIANMSVSSQNLPSYHRMVWATFSDDWAYMFHWYWYSNKTTIYKRSTSQAFLPSTLTSQWNKAFSQMTQAYQVRFSNDWLTMYLSDRDSNWKIHQYRLTTPYDLNTAVYNESLTLPTNSTWVWFDLANNWRTIFVWAVTDWNLWQYDAH
jgi:hypothetical protein